MKLFTVAAAFLLAASSAAAASAVRTVDVSPQKGIDYDILEAASGRNSCGAKGSALISQDFANELLSNAGLAPASPSEGTVIQTRFLTEDLRPHVDRKIETGLPVNKGSSVAFISMNDNEKAHFVHGDERHPIVKNQMYHFDGSVEHGVIVESGNVQLLGPFDMPSFGVVGEDGSSCADRTIAECCVGEGPDGEPDEDVGCAICVYNDVEPSLMNHMRGTKAPKSGKKGTGSSGGKKGPGGKKGTGTKAPKAGKKGISPAETCNPQAVCVANTPDRIPEGAECSVCPPPEDDR